MAKMDKKDIQDLYKAIRDKYKNFNILDFGLRVEINTYKFNNNNCITPSPIVIAYTLGIFGSGKPRNIFLAGFDGYSLDDSRTKEVNNIFTNFCNKLKEINLFSITPTKYNLQTKSIYAL